MSKMELVKICGNDKTNSLNVEVRYPDIENQLFKDQDTVKGVLDILEYIDQPLNMTCSSLLQLACKYTNNPSVVEFLLEQGANPLYLDLNGDNAMSYTSENRHKDLQDKILLLLHGMKEYYLPTNEKSKRKEEGWTILKNEIKKHFDKIAFQNTLP